MWQLLSRGKCAGTQQAWSRVQRLRRDVAHWRVSGVAFCTILILDFCVSLWKYKTISCIRHRSCFDVLIDDISNFQVSILHESWTYITDMYICKSIYIYTYIEIKIQTHVGMYIVCRYVRTLIVCPTWEFVDIWPMYIEQIIYIYQSISKTK